MIEEIRLRDMDDGTKAELYDNDDGSMNIELLSSGDSVNLDFGSALRLHLWVGKWLLSNTGRRNDE